MIHHPVKREKVRAESGDVPAEQIVTLVPSPQESINFSTTGNVFIEGDNLQVLKLLLKPYSGRVKLICVDPIHNTSQAFANQARQLLCEDGILCSLLDSAEPAGFLRGILQSLPQKEGMIFDFSAGFCTTAEVVLELNRQDGGRRRFTLVQSPETTGNKDHPSSAAVGKERIRRVLAQFQKDTDSNNDFSDGSNPEDLGFKVFRLATSQMDFSVPGWQVRNVLWEVALREGYSLNTWFEPKTLGNGVVVYEANDPDTGQKFTICLEDKLTLALSRYYEFSADRLFICRDIALDDSAAANLALQCRLKTI